MTSEPRTVPKPEWSALPREGCLNVEGKVLLRQDNLKLAMLRFAPDGTLDEHSAECEIDVICLEGEGFISIGDVQSSFRAGQSLTWPKGQLHKLWTGAQSMITLMVEHG
jgi:quercetin dioxygenase-like cupin family protein